MNTSLYQVRRPTAAQLATWEDRIRRKTMVDERMREFFQMFPRRSHPMPVLASGLMMLSTFSFDSLGETPEAIEKVVTIFRELRTGQTLDFSGFYVWLTSNIGSAELMSLQHSNEATLERHVLTRAQQALRPEIFARVNEKLVFHRLSYEHQLEIAEKFLSREIEFLAARGHRIELDKTALPFLVRKGFHPKLGARPMRDAVEKLVGDAVTECLLTGRPACGILAHDELHDRLGVF